MAGLASNLALRGLLTECGWTQDFLAGRVSDLAGEAGLAMRWDRRSVTHWLAGRRPRPPLPGLIAEAFTRGLGHVVTPGDFGMEPVGRPRRSPGPAGWEPADDGCQPADGDAEAAAAGEPDQATVFTQLARYGGQRRALAGDAYSLAALAAPAWVPASAARARWPGGPVGGPAGQPPPCLEAGQVAATEQMVRVFSDADTAFGGGHVRAALAAYLAHDVAPRLRAPASRALRRRMLSAATQLAYLCGFTCFDDQLHAFAQRCYLTALELAAENGDPAAHAVTLRALSVQACTLGHSRHAVQLAEAANAAGRRAVPPARQAFLLGQVAVAAAADGDRPAALSALTTAERRLSRATSSGAPADTVMGHYHPAALAHQQAAVQALLGDRPGAITALTQSLRHRPSGERRSRAITTARLAELQLRQGHLEQAAATWHAFLDDYPHLTSARATSALRTLRSRLHPHAATPAARHLLTRATVV